MQAAIEKGVLKSKFNEEGFEFLGYNYMKESHSHGAENKVGVKEDSISWFPLYMHGTFRFPGTAKPTWKYVVA